MKILVKERWHLLNTDETFSDYCTVYTAEEAIEYLKTKEVTQISILANGYSSPEISKYIMNGARNGLPRLKWDLRNYSFFYEKIKVNLEMADRYWDALDAMKKRGEI